MTTATALTKSLRLENNSSDRGNVFYTEPSNYICHQRQDSYVELHKYEKCRIEKQRAEIFDVVFLTGPFVTLIIISAEKQSTEHIIQYKSFKNF